jgi:hypothetical protein
MSTIEPKQQYVYPAVFTPPREEGECWYIYFPDFAEDRKVYSRNLESAILYAHSVLQDHVNSFQGGKYPKPPISSKNVTVNDGEILQLVVVSPEDSKEARGGDPFFRFIKFIAAVICIGVLMSAAMLSSAKPVIYLYPEEPTEVSVKLKYNGTLTHTWPSYGEGWEVTAYPDGTLVNHADGREYSYLFWEGDTKVPFDFSSGFVVKGADTGEFLREKLDFLGLTPREYNEFIVYWLPLMEGNAYNLISFQGVAYTDNAVLTVDPRPDIELRVYMAFKALSFPITVPPQELKPFQRKGFTLVEWGGSQVK